MTIGFTRRLASAPLLDVAVAPLLDVARLRHILHHVGDYLFDTFDLIVNRVLVWRAGSQDSHTTGYVNRQPLERLRGIIRLHRFHIAAPRELRLFA